MYKISLHPTGRMLSLVAAFSTLAISSIQAQLPTDNPVASHYGPGGYPLWTDNLRWDNVYDMTTYGAVAGGNADTNGVANFNAFEAARDAAYVAGGGVLYWPAGTYYFRLPDVGYGAGIGPKSRGLMLKSGVVIRGADLAPGADQAIIRESEVHTESGFYRVTYNLAPQTVFRFQTQIRGTDPVTGNPNSAGEVPRDWNFIGMVPGEGEDHVGQVQDIGVVNVKLDGGFVFWGFHTTRSATLDSGRWLHGWKDNWPAGAPLEDTWAKRVPDGTHYMDAINGGLDWHTPIEAGAGRLIFGVYSINGAPWDDMSNIDMRPAATTEWSADSFHSYRYTGRLTAHGSDIFIGNNVLAKPTKNFVHTMLQRWDNAGNVRQNAVVLFDYSNHIGVDVNKSNYGGRQNDETVVGPDTGYHYPNAIVRDNWIFNRGNKGMDIAGQWLVLYNNHNERYHARRIFPIDYITNPQYYINQGLGVVPGLVQSGAGIDAGGISFDGWRWQQQTTASDYMSRGYDIGGRNIHVERNSVINTGSIGNDGEGIMAQRHNNLETFSWAFIDNVQANRDLGPGTWGEPGWNGIYDMHAVGFLHWGNAGPGWSGFILAASNNNWVLDTTIGPNLGTGSTHAPVVRPRDGTPAVRYADYQPMHTDPVNPPINVTGSELPDQSGIVITWEDDADNELGFRVERRLDGGPWRVMAYRPAQSLGAITNKTSPYTTSLSGAELNPTRWVDFTANASMAPEYRVVAFNELDDDSTGVSLSWFADPDALKVSFPAFPDDEVFVTSDWSTAGITVAAAIEDGDGSLVSYSWSQFSGPGTVTFSAPSAASTHMSFSTVGIYRVQVSVSDATYSTARMLTVHAGVPVAIAAHPQSQNILMNDPVTFSVSVSGSEPFSYQWFKDGIAIPEADASSYTVSSVQLADAGEYTVVVTNPLGSVESEGAVLTVLSAPIFLLQPQSTEVSLGMPATLSTSVTANPAATFQWYFNNEPIPNAKGAVLTINGASLADSGNYHVVATNIYGSTTSDTAILTVSPKHRYFIAWNKENYSMDPAGNTWQSANMHVGGNNSAPRELLNIPLVNRDGRASLGGIKFSQTASFEDPVVVYRTGSNLGTALFTTPDREGRAIPAWFDVSQASQRAAFAFNLEGGYFDYTFSGFDPEDQVTFEFVFRRDGTGNRPVTLIANPGPEQVLVLNAYSTTNTHGPGYPRYSTTGSTSYTFRLLDTSNQQIGGPNAMMIEVEYANIPTGPQVTLASALVRGTVGQPATLAVEVTGTGELAFQWFKDGAAIDGATGATLELDRLVFADVGSYTVQVTDFFGTVTSEPILVEAVVMGELESVFLETFDAGVIGEPVTVTLSDINWNVHHSFGGHSMIGRDMGVLLADPNNIFDPQLITERGDHLFGSALGFVQLFMNDRPNYGRAGAAGNVNAGTRQEWPNAELPGPHPVTGNHEPNRELAVFLWTEDEVSIDDETRAGLAEFSFVQGNRNAAAHSFLPAIRIGEEWFVYYVDQEYLRDNVRPQQMLLHMNPWNEFNAEGVFGAATFFNPDYEENTNGTQAQLYRFAWSESGWSRLVFDGGPGVDSTVGMTVGEALEGDLPAGSITAIGVFAPENIGGGQLNGHRIDSIRLAAASELPVDQITPIILTQPVSVTVDFGSAIELSVEFTAPAGEVGVQWFKDGEAIAGANDTVLTINSATLVDAGAYTVAITNAAGTTTSQAATVVVNFSFEAEVDPLEFGPQDGSGEILVFTVAGYSYNVSSSAAWLTVDGGPVFIGEDIIGFTVSANTSGVMRSAVLTVDGDEFLIRQAANVVDFFPGAQPANPEIPGSVVVEWLGWAYTIAEEGFVWTWTPAHGWWAAMPAQAVGESAAFFMWDATVKDWWYVIASAYPWLYAFNVNGAESHGWLYFFEDTNPRLFFSVNEEDFVTELELYGQP